MNISANTVLKLEDAATAPTIDWKDKNMNVAYLIMVVMSATNQFFDDKTGKAYAYKDADGKEYASLMGSASDILQQLALVQSFEDGSNASIAKLQQLLQSLPSMPFITDEKSKDYGHIDWKTYAATLGKDPSGKPYSANEAEAQFRSNLYAAWQNVYGSTNPDGTRRGQITTSIESDGNDNWTIKVTEVKDKDGHPVPCYMDSLRDALYRSYAGIPAGRAIPQPRDPAIDAQVNANPAYSGLSELASTDGPIAQCMGSDKYAASTTLLAWLNSATPLDNEYHLFDNIAFQTHEYDTKTGDDQKKHKDYIGNVVDDGKGTALAISQLSGQSNTNGTKITANTQIYSNYDNTAQQIIESTSKGMLGFVNNQRTN